MTLSIEHSSCLFLQEIICEHAFRRGRNNISTVPLLFISKAGIHSKENEDCCLYSYLMGQPLSWTFALPREVSCLSQGHRGKPCCTAVQKTQYPASLRKRCAQAPVSPSFARTQVGLLFPPCFDHRRVVADIFSFLIQSVAQSVDCLYSCSYDPRFHGPFLLIRRFGKSGRL